MLFSRRNKRSTWSKVQNFLWPKAGWRRTLFYFKHRVGRMPGTPSGIAIGLACGAAVAFSPLLGVHFLLAAALAWVLRGSMVAAAAGTLVGNPWTLPLMFAADFRVGCWILGTTGGEVSIARLLDNPLEALAPVFWPLMLGSIPLGVLAWFIVYWISYKMISRYHAQRAHRMRLRRNRPGLDKHEGASA